MNGIIFGAMADDEPLSLHTRQLDELLAENISNALLELLPELPPWMLDSKKRIPFMPKKDVTDGKPKN
jgi:hypothetical protein